MLLSNILTVPLIISGLLISSKRTFDCYRIEKQLIVAGIAWGLTLVFN